MLPLRDLAAEVPKNAKKNKATRIPESGKEPPESVSSASLGQSRVQTRQSLGERFVTVPLLQSPA
jgi:hypothetical protein